MTTQAEIGGWFDKGVADGAAYMVVWCDTYDWSDYPVYYEDERAAQESLDRPASMQKAMECYDLRGSKLVQLSQQRAWALRPKR